LGRISRPHRLNGLSVLNFDAAAEAERQMLRVHHFDFVIVFRSAWKFEFSDEIQPQTG